MKILIYNILIKKINLKDTFYLVKIKQKIVKNIFNQ